MAKTRTGDKRPRGLAKKALHAHPDLAPLLALARRFQWTMSNPPTAPTGSDSTGDAESYLEEHAYCAKVV